MLRRQREPKSLNRQWGGSHQVPTKFAATSGLVDVADPNIHSVKKQRRQVHFRMLCSLWIGSVLAGSIYLERWYIGSSTAIITNKNFESNSTSHSSASAGRTTKPKSQALRDWEAIKRKILSGMDGEKKSAVTSAHVRRPSKEGQKRVAYRVVMGRAPKKREKVSTLNPRATSLKSINVKKDDNDYSLAIKRKLLCSPWNVSLDDFWLEYPDWEPSDNYTNDTHTCFEPILDLNRAEFFIRINQNQFVTDPQHNRRCDPLVPDRRRGLAIAPIEQAGFAALLLFKQRNAFWSAFRQDRTFQHALPHPEFVWQYVPPYNATLATTATNWPACPTNDMDCYFLPVTNCPRHVGPEGNATWIAYKLDPKLVWGGDMKTDSLLQIQLVWLSLYMMRPRQETRRRLYELIKRESPIDAANLRASNCTWVHVRRADAMTEGKKYPRNFYPISEYLERGNIQPGETIYLLTDDVSAIEEATTLHPEYHWIYWNRTRYRGPQTRNQHFPSQNKGLETLRLLAETKLAGQCRKGVHGNSNVVRMMILAMTVEYGADNIETIEIDKRIKNKRIEAAAFMEELDKKLALAREQGRLA